MQRDPQIPVVKYSSRTSWRLLRPLLVKGIKILPVWKISAFVLRMPERRSRTSYLISAPSLLCFVRQYFYKLHLKRISQLCCFSLVCHFSLELFSVANSIYKLFLWFPTMYHLIYYIYPFLDCLISVCKIKQSLDYLIKFRSFKTFKNISIYFSFKLQILL